MKKLLIDVWHAFKAKKKVGKRGWKESEVKTMSCACWEIILKAWQREEGKWVNLINFTLAAQMGKDCVYVHTKVLFSNALIINSSTVNQKFTLFHVDRVRRHFKALTIVWQIAIFYLNFSCVKLLKVFNIFFSNFKVFPHDARLKV